MLMEQKGGLNSKSNKKNKRHENNDNTRFNHHSRALLASTLSLCLFLASLSPQLISAAVVTNNAAPANRQPSENEKVFANQDQLKAAALEDELNYIVGQHDANEGDNRQLADAIISRLMVDNLTRSSLLNSGDLDNEVLNIASSGDQMQVINDNQQAEPLEQVNLSGPNGMETIKLRKLLSLLQNYENVFSNQAYNQFPMLPAGQSATMKRAAAKIGNYLQRHPSAYSRNNFDFGLGKRPDSSGSVLRIGDSSIGGSVQAVGQFGKRPSAHRYDFGLGKRLASPTYPRYDFGLGKRATSRIRYDFGLGKK